MRISFISAAGLFMLGCVPGIPRPEVTPSSACPRVAAAEAPGGGSPFQRPLFIDARAFAVTTPENVSDVTRAMDALLQATQRCPSARLQEQP
jgi:hypothetical protein